MAGIVHVDEFFVGGKGNGNVLKNVRSENRQPLCAVATIHFSEPYKHCCDCVRGQPERIRTYSKGLRYNAN
jgi:hypothetical protein